MAPYFEDFEFTGYVPNEPYGKSVGAVHRGLEILELFAVEQTPLSVGEVSEKLGYPQSSTSVLLHGLHSLGYLVHDRRARTFYPTVRVTFLGLWMHHRIFSEGSLLQLMQTLADRSGHVVLLAHQNGVYAQYLHIVSARVSRVGLKPGLLRPICHSAVGKVLLSALSDEEAQRLARNANAIDGLAPPADVDQLLEEVRTCRRTGFAYSQGSVTPGSSVIATRLPVDVAGLPLAIGIGLHTEELAERKSEIERLLADTIAQHFSSEAVSRRLTRTWLPPRQPRYAVERDERSTGQEDKPDTD